MTRFLKPSEHRQRYVVISDDVLVINLAKSRTPGVARLELSELPMLNLHVRVDQQGAHLGFTTSRDDFVVLGVFADRSDADDLLAEMRRELFKIEKLHKFFSWRTVVIAVLIIIILNLLGMAYAWIVRPMLPQLNEPLALEEMRAPAVEFGKPMDADNKLTIPDNTAPE